MSRIRLSRERLGVARDALGLLLAAEVGLQLLLGRVPILNIGLGARTLPSEIFIVGAVVGSLYALVGMGLILVYRANRVINFAQAQLGAVPAIVALLLIRKGTLPYVAAAPIVFLGAPLLGGLTEMSLVRRFDKAPRLILTVVTIGVSYLLLMAEFVAARTIRGDSVDAGSLDFPTPFGHVEHRVGVITFSGDHLMAALVSLTVMVALGAFFRLTNIGIGVRAAAENGDRAALLGIPVRRLSTTVWCLAALLSAIGVFLRAPLLGLPVGGFAGPTILFYGLAVAVMSRMESLPRALSAGVLVGMVEQASSFATNRAAAADGALFVLVLVALLAQRRTLARALDSGASTWLAVREIRPIPRALRTVPSVRRAGIALATTVALFAIAVPQLVGAEHTGAATLIVIYSMIGVSLVVLTGWAGQISLGQYAIAGVGSAVAGTLAVNHNWDFFATLAAGMVAGALLAVVIGLPALRLQGLLLAVTTLAFAFAVRGVLSRAYTPWLFPEEGKVIGRPVLWGLLDLSSTAHLGPVSISGDAKFYYVCLVFLLVVMGMAKAFRSNRSGRVLIGLRDNARMAQSFGIAPVSSRLAAFALSGSFAGLAGALLAYQNGVIASNALPPERSVEVFIMSVIGGIASVPGAVLGAVFVRGLPLLPGLRDIEQVGLLTSGAGLLLVLQFLPGGLADGLVRLRDAWLRRVERGNATTGSVEAQEATSAEARAVDSDTALRRGEVLLGAER